MKYMIKKYTEEQKTEYKRWFDLSMRVYGEICDMQTRAEQEAYLKDYECKDIVLAMLDGERYAQLIWNHVSPGEVIKMKVTPLPVEFGSGREIIKHYLENVEYIGEEGGMVTDGYITREEARQRMINKWKEDCGEEEAKEFASTFELEDICEGYFHLMTPEMREKLGAPASCEWFVSQEKVSAYKVWVYWG